MKRTLLLLLLCLSMVLTMLPAPAFCGGGKDRRTRIGNGRPVRTPSEA